MRCKYQVGTRFVLRLKESRRGGSVFLHAHHDAPFRVATVEDMERLLGPQLDDEAALEGVTTATEGEARIRWSTRYERSAELRAAAIRTHGLRCMGCGFSFPEVYGELGAGFIEVHHLKPVSSRGRANVDVRTEMVVLCANCHAMVHRRKGRPLVIEELRRALEQQRRGAGQA
jgi:predicted HNH restriction endonuclease